MPVYGIHEFIQYKMSSTSHIETLTYELGKVPKTPAYVSKRIKKLTKYIIYTHITIETPKRHKRMYI